MNGGAPRPDHDPVGPVRVLVVSTSPLVWGAERSLLRLAPLLRAQGIVLTLASPSGAFAEAWSDAGLPHVECPAAPRLGLRTAADGRPGVGALAREAVTTGRSARRLARLARDADVVHSNSLWGHLDCAVAGRLARRPVVLELHDLVRPGLGRVVLRAAMRLASSTVAISRAVADTVGGHRGHRRGLRVGPQAVDPEWFRPGPPEPGWRARLSSRPDEPIVGIVGRIDPEKGIGTVVRAMTMLEGPAARSHLAVVGAPALDDGSYERELRDEASTLLGDRSRFVGPVDEVPAVLRALDVLVNASASEPFGLSVLEAQACGVPVIGTDAGGIPEFVTDGETGLLVAPGRPEALAAGLSRLLGAPALRRHLTAEARAGVVAHHTLAVRARALAEVYRAVARTRQGREVAS
jgi:glycosyltransferase involved in cell wall biosynthesis